MNLLEIEGLTCGYNKKEVLTDVNLVVKEGEFLGITGPNGCGKTTLFRAIMRSLRPMQGRIKLKGEDYSKLTVKEISRRVAVLPQVVDIPFGFSVREFVSLGRYPYLDPFGGYSPHDLKVIHHIMWSTDILHLSDRSVNQLSGGERQRVLLAQALVQEPHLLLLDEPLTHLDIRYQVEILQLLGSLNKEGLTVIMISHDLNLAAEYCDRLILMEGGRIFTAGLPEEVLNPQIVEQVYKTKVVVSRSPVSGKPMILLVSKRV